MVGLFIIEAHRRIRDLATAVQSELSAIGDIVDFLQYLENGGGARARTTAVKDALKVYVENEVIGDLHPSRRRSAARIQRRKSTKQEQRRREVSEIIRSVKSLTPREDDADDRIALDAIIKKIGELTTFRAQKTEVARRGFPIPFYILLLFMSAVIILGVSLLPVEAPPLHYLLVAFTSFAACSLLLMIWDLDRPLTGYWNLNDELGGDVVDIVARLDSATPRRC